MNTATHQRDTRRAVVALLTAHGYTVTAQHPTSMIVGRPGVRDAIRMERLTPDDWQRLATVIPTLAPDASVDALCVAAWGYTAPDVSVPTMYALERYTNDCTRRRRRLVTMTMQEALPL